MELLPINANPTVSSLPSLSDGFNINLSTGEWSALFPRHHLMWVSPNRHRTKQFIDLATTGLQDYSHLLTSKMIDSFSQFFVEPLPTVLDSNPFPGGQMLSSAISFLPTNDCGLACKYCFSAAQPRKYGVISWEIAKAAIDLGSRNAILNRLRHGSGKLEIRFFGGGEPTEYWDRFAEIVEYARECADANDIDISVATITNGQIDENHFSWFLNNIDEITVSMDGPADIQNFQRPRADGTDSFDKTWRFLAAMDEGGMPINAIRITVTAHTVPRMSEIAEFFWNSFFHAYPLQFEPVYFSEVGRQNTDMPSATAFTNSFREVELLSRSRCKSGLLHSSVNTATRPLTLRPQAYCDSLEGRGIFVTPDGYMSLCSEISTHSDPRKDSYFVGQYSPSTRAFKMYDNAASTVRSNTPWWCRGCYARFSCKGGCEPRSQNSNKNVRKWWCQMVRKNILTTWTDVVTNSISPRGRFLGDNGEQLIWLPVYEAAPSMDA